MICMAFYAIVAARKIQCNKSMYGNRFSRRTRQVDAPDDVCRCSDLCQSRRFRHALLLYRFYHDYIKYHRPSLFGGEAILSLL